MASSRFSISHAAAPIVGDSVSITLAMAAIRVAQKFPAMPFKS